MPANTHDDQRPPGIRARDGHPDLHGDDLAVLTRHANVKPCIYCNDTGLIDVDEENEAMVAHGHAGGVTQKCFYCKPTEFEKED